MKHLSKEEMLECVEESYGLINRVRKKIAAMTDGRCGWATAKRLIALYPDVVEAFELEMEINKDLAEEVLIDDYVVNKNVESAKWYLAHVGKDRGYTKQFEVKAVDSYEGLPDDIKNWTIEDFARATFAGEQDTDEDNDLLYSEEH